MKNIIDKFSNNNPFNSHENSLLPKQLKSNTMNKLSSKIRTDQAHEFDYNVNDEIL